MRVCAKHFKKATETLISLITKEEFDLCPDCEVELRDILHAKPENVSGGNIGTRKPAGRGKAKKPRNIPPLDGID